MNQTNPFGFLNPIRIANFIWKKVATYLTHPIPSALHAIEEGSKARKLSELDNKALAEIYKFLHPQDLLSISRVNEFFCKSVRIFLSGNQGANGNLGALAQFVQNNPSIPIDKRIELRNNVQPKNDKTSYQITDILDLNELQVVALKNVIEKASWFTHLKLPSAVTDETIQSIKESHKLSGIDVEWSYITTISLTHLTKIANLTYLNIANSKGIKEKELDTILYFKKLTYLNLSGCHVTDRLLNQFGSFNQLKTLNLTLCESITDTGLKSLSEFCQSLQSLDLNCLSIKKIASLANLKNLKELTLLRYEGDIPSEEYASLGALENLQLLFISSCSIKDKDLAFISNLTKLVDFEINSCFDISDNGLNHLPTNLHNLIINNRQFINFTLEVTPKINLVKLMKRFQYLHSLKLNYRVTNELTEVLSKIPTLEEIDIPCDFLNSDGYANIFKLVNLRKLKLNMCEQLSDVDMEKIDTLTNIEELSILHCRNLTYNGIQSLKKLPKLKKVYLHENYNIKMSDDKMKPILNHIRKNRGSFLLKNL